MKFKIKLEYNGEAFSGWQYQSDDIVTVQNEIERALSILIKSYSKLKDVNFDFKLTGSGRTDRGVHAKGQVATFYWPDDLTLDLERFRMEVNGITSRDLVLKEIVTVPNDFCARFSKHFKRYAYSIHNAWYPPVLDKNQVWWITKKLNFESMFNTLRHIEGTHDFSSFRASDCCAKTTVRTLSKVELIKTAEDRIVLIVEGNGFLKNMIRILAGTIVDVGRGNISCDDFLKIIEAKDRKLAGATAPAHGLCLEFVKYE